jgi:ketosteroid isomerase-like protein
MSTYGAKNARQRTWRGTGGTENGRLAELTGGTFRAQPKLFTTDGRGTVIVQHDYEGTRDGKDVGQPNALIFRIEGGKIVELTDTTSDLDAFDKNWA